MNLDIFLCLNFSREKAKNPAIVNKLPVLKLFQLFYLFLIFFPSMPTASTNSVFVVVFFCVFLVLSELKEYYHSHFGCFMYPRWPGKILMARL